MDRPASAAASFARLGPTTPATPVIVSVPHAGRDYPEALLAAARLGRKALEQFEDRLVDRLVAPLADKGHALIVARRARAWIDLNRAEDEFDPLMITPPPPPDAVVQSARVRGGLGLVPRRLIGAGEVYRRPIDEHDLRRRIAEAYLPFHAALADAIEATRRRFGIAVLIDCHSMPPLAHAGEGGRPASVVIGDREGGSADGRFVQTAARIFRAHQLAVAFNAPYAGGHIVARHGLAGGGAHAMQIELCRSLYLDAPLRDPGPRFGEIGKLMGALADALADAALAGDDLLAAE